MILSLAFERLRPRLVAHGASDADVTAARAVLEDPQHQFTGPSTWTAWGAPRRGWGLAYVEWAERHPWTVTRVGSALAAVPLPIMLSVDALNTTEAVILAVALFLTFVGIQRLASRMAGRLVVFGPFRRF